MGKEGGREEGRKGRREEGKGRGAGGHGSEAREEVGWRRRPYILIIYLILYLKSVN